MPRSTRPRGRASLDEYMEVIIECPFCLANYKLDCRLGILRGLIHET
jgi:hypothetical protein